MLDSQLRYVSATRRWAELYELEGEELLGLSHPEAVPTLPSAWIEQYERCLAGETLTVREDKLELPSGRIHWLRRLARPWRDRCGEIQGLILSDEVIDEWKEATLALEQQAAFLQGVLENTEDGIVACDTNGRLSLFNAATRRVHAADSEPVPPEQWAERYDLYDVDGITPLRMEQVPLYRAFSGETVEKQKLTIAVKGRPLRHLVASGSPMYDARGTFLGAMISMHDVTDQVVAETRWHDAESRYRAIFNNTFQFCGLLDRSGTLLEVNDTAREVAGVPREELVGKAFWDCRWWVADATARKRLKAGIKRAAAGEFIRYEIDLQSRLGRQIPIDFSLKPVRNANGKIERLIAEGRDLSEKRESESLLQQITDSLPFFVAYLDKQNVFRFINRTGAAWYALAQDDVLGRSLQSVVGAETASEVGMDLCEKAGQGDYHTERELQFPDGKHRVVHCTYLPDCADPDASKGNILLAIDITEKKRAQESVRLQRNELELILNNVPIRVFYKDDRNRILRLNEPAARSMGLSVAEAEGADTYDLFPEMAAKYHRDDLEVIESGVPKLGIVERYTPIEGRHGWVSTDKVPYVDPETGNRYLFVAASDITDQKQASDALKESEQRYRRFYEKTPVMLQSLDGEMCLLSCSDFWLQRLGYDRKDVIGKPLFDFMTESSAEQMRSALMEVRDGSSVITERECQLVSSDGSHVDVLFSAIPADTNDSSGECILSVVIDITERKQVELQLLQAQKMESVGQLTGGLAHDLNNLLGVVMGNLQLLERAVRDDEKLSPRISAALEAVETGAALNKRLLAYSRRQKLEPRVLAPRPLLSSLGDMLHRVLGEHIDLLWDLQEDLPDVRVDPAQLESAILNLAVNARDAMPDGGHLTVEASSRHFSAPEAELEDDTRPGHYLRIAVSDTGKGIAPEHLGSVFEPFYTTKDVGEGSGLGLSMVYGFVRQSGGVVRIYSEVDRGTTVRIYLPVAGNVVECPPDPIVENVKVANGRSETILVVEDQPAVRDIASSLLRELGYKVVEACSGAEAIEVFRSHQEIDLLFTDIVMPGGMDGTQLAQQLQAIRPNLPVLYTSGYADLAVLHRGEVHSSHNLVTKPYKFNELAQKIGMALQE